MGLVDGCRARQRARLALENVPHNSVTRKIALHAHAKAISSALLEMMRPDCVLPSRSGIG